MVEGRVNEQDQDSKKCGYLEAQQQRVVLTFATATFTTETGPKACFTRQSLLCYLQTNRTNPPGLDLVTDWLHRPPPPPQNRTKIGTYYCAFISLFICQSYHIKNQKSHNCSCKPSTDLYQDRWEKFVSQLTQTLMTSGGSNHSEVSAG